MFSSVFSSALSRTNNKHQPSSICGARKSVPYLVWKLPKKLRTRYHVQIIIWSTFCSPLSKKPDFFGTTLGLGIGVRFSFMALIQNPCRNTGTISPVHTIFYISFFPYCILPGMYVNLHIPCKGGPTRLMGCPYLLGLSGGSTATEQESLPQQTTPAPCGSKT